MVLISVPVRGRAFANKAAEKAMLAQVFPPCSGGPVLITEARPWGTARERRDKERPRGVSSPSLRKPPQKSMPTKPMTPQRWMHYITKGGDDNG